MIALGPAPPCVQPLPLGPCGGLDISCAGSEFSSHWPPVPLHLQLKLNKMSDQLPAYQPFLWLSATGHALAAAMSIDKSVRVLSAEGSAG